MAELIDNEAWLEGYKDWEDGYGCPSEHSARQGWLTAEKAHDGILVGQTYGESEPVEPPPAGHSWVPIQRDDNNPRYEDDEAAAAAYAALIGSPVDPVWGEPTDRPREGSCDVFVAVKNKLTDPEEDHR